MPRDDGGCANDPATPHEVRCTLNPPPTPYAPAVAHNPPKRRVQHLTPSQLRPVLAAIESRIAYLVALEDRLVAAGHSRNASDLGRVAHDAFRAMADLRAVLVREAGGY